MHSGRAIHSEERLDFYMHTLKTPLPLQFFPFLGIRWERGVVARVKKIAGWLQLSSSGSRAVQLLVVGAWIEVQKKL